MTHSGVMSHWLKVNALEKAIRYISECSIRHGLMLEQCHNTEAKGILTPNLVSL